MSFMKYRFSYYLLCLAAGGLSLFLIGSAVHVLINEGALPYDILLLCFIPVVLMWLLLRRIRLFSYRAAYADHLSGEDFEQFLVSWFRHHGYRHIERTKKTRDYGADLIMHKHFHTYVVQAKRYDGNIGVHAIQEALAAKAYYKADQAIVVTNRYFTKSARTLAEVNDVRLMDRQTLFHVKEKAQKNQR